MRATPLLLALLLVAAVAPAQTGQDSLEAPPALAWWGPDSFQTGWNLRVPLTVTNPHDHPLDHPMVQAELDLEELALAAGWPAGQVGERTLLKGFTLQPDSVRVIEYTNFQLPRTRASDATTVEAAERDGHDAFVVPSLVHRGFLVGQEERPYDPETNPALSVSWRVPGVVEPGAARSFVLYLDVLQNGERPAQDPQQVHEALGGLHWVQKGHQVYAAGKHATIYALHPGTRVSLEVYDGPSPKPHEQSPLRFSQGDWRTTLLAPEPVPFRVTANKPVLVTGQKPGADNANHGLRQTGFIPSIDQGLRGRTFDAVVAPGLYFIHPTTSQGAVGQVNGRSFSVTTDPAAMVVGPADEPLVRLRAQATQPVLIQGEPELHRYPLVDRSGAPVGNQLIGTIHGAYCGSGDGSCHGSDRMVERVGGVRVFTVAGQADIQLRVAGSDGRLVAPSQRGVESMHVAPQESTYLVHREEWGFQPFEVRALDPSNPGALDPSATIAALGGAPDTYPYSPIRQTGIGMPIGGQWARNYTANADAHVFAFYNDTQVHLTHGDGSTEVHLLDQGRRTQVSASPVAPFILNATKPVAVVPTTGVAYGAAALDSLPVTLGGLQYRGYLLSLVPMGNETEPMVRTTSFGQTVSYEFQVQNLAKRADGSGLSDQVELAHGALPPGWTANLTPSLLELGPEERATVNLTLTTPEVREQEGRLRLPVTATSRSNPRMQAQVETVTLLQERRGVGTWYESVDGPQQLLLRFDPGEERTLPLVVQNQGSGRDHLRLTLNNVQAGWNVRVLGEEGRVNGLTLDPGAHETLDLSVQAPPAGGLVLPTSFTVTAASENETTVSDKVLFDGLVLAESKLALDTEHDHVQARPGDRLAFPLGLGNEGNASTAVQLNVSVDLPPGWQTPRFLFQGRSLSGVDNRLSSLPPTGDEPLPLTLEVPVPPNATGRSHLKLLVSATPTGGGADRPVTLPLSLYVQPVIDLQVETPPRLALRAGTTSHLELGLSNLGNANATLRLDPLEVPRGWTLHHPGQLRAVPGQPTALGLDIGVPPATDPTNTTVSLQVTLPNGTTTTIAAPVQVLSGPGLEVQPPSPVTIVPGVRTNVTMVVRSTGNEPALADLDVQAPPGWNVTTRATPAALAPLQQGEVTLGLLPPRDAEGVQEVLLSPPGQGASEPSNLNVTVARPDLELRGVTASLENGATILRGHLVNHGPPLVHNLTIALVDGNEALDRVTLTEVPVDHLRSFALEVPAGTPVDGLSVWADPRDRVAETDEGNNRQAVPAVDGASDVPFPPLAPLVALLLALLGRRRR